MSKLEDLRQLYFSVTKATIDRDFDRAIDLLKSMSEEERERAAVFMDGIAEMRREWKGTKDKSFQLPVSSSKFKPRKTDDS
jgi:hypothetical protein